MKKQKKRKKQRSINFQGSYEELKYGFDKVNKWHLEHPSYNRAAAIYNWYWYEYCNDDNLDAVFETISQHKERLAARKEKELGAGIVFDDYQKFFYRFWEELLNTAEEDVEEEIDWFD